MILAWMGCGGDQEYVNPEIDRAGFGEADHLDMTARPGLHHAQVFQLEATGTHAGDTSGPGIDRGALFVDEPTRHLFCFEDPEGQEHRMRILDSAGNVLLDLAANDCGAVDLEAGEYIQEYEHGQRGQEDALPVPILVRPILGGDGVQAAIETRGMVRSALAASCSVSDCTVRKMAYSSLNLGEGQVALFPTRCPAQAGDEVWVFQGNCNDTGIPKVRGIRLGPWTQSVVYESRDFKGAMHGFNSRLTKETCIPDDLASISDGHSSVRIIPMDATAPIPCEVVSGGYYCTGCAAPFTGSPANTTSGKAAESLPVNTTARYVAPAQGQVLVYGSAPTDSCCHGALVLHGACPDLGLFGFDKTITSVVLPEQTEVDLFGDAAFGGTRAGFSTPGSHELVDHDGFHTGKAEASSLIVDTWKGINRATLVSTYRCTGCNLQGANLAGFDAGGVAVALSGADLTGADMTGAQIPGANLTGAMLRQANLSMANLKGATMTGAMLGETRDGTGKLTLGAAILDGAWMEDVRLDGKADLTAVRARGAYFYSGAAAAATVAGAMLANADFTGAVLKGLNMREATIAGATFHQADLTKAILASVVASDASAGSVDFTEASLQGADLTGTDYDRADFTGAVLNTARVSAVVRMVLEAGFDATGKRVYVPQYRTFTCEPQIPDRLPKSTSSATKCPDGAAGPCTGFGGESGLACPFDCSAGSECQSARHCVAVEWDAGLPGGHWACVSGVCTEVPDKVGCGNGVCEADKGETPASCPADCAMECRDPAHCWALSWGGSGSGNWMCDPAGRCIVDPKPLFCGDGLCFDFVGESAASCAGDCGSEPECDGSANRCLNRSWPLGTCQGRWTCESAKCKAVCDDHACGDGICDWEGGESPMSCIRDCVQGGCTERAHCTGRAWPFTQDKCSGGHWECAADGTCKAICEDNTCGDGRCDRNGRWISR
jgi:uncharacterized protein YjbI with pentapeptide repeats